MRRAAALVLNARQTAPAVDVPVRPDGLPGARAWRALDRHINADGRTEQLHDASTVSCRGRSWQAVLIWSGQECHRRYRA